MNFGDCGSAKRGAVGLRVYTLYHPKHKDIYYPINYGYIEGIIAPDGEEQDAYILGVTESVEEFTGTVIAIIHRHDDVEEKWLLCRRILLLLKKKLCNNET